MRFGGLGVSPSFIFKMLWNYTEISLGLAVIFTYCAFNRNTERVGRIFYFLAGGLHWVIAAWGMVAITFKWAGDNSVISYTYMPTWEGRVMMFSIGFLGILMFYIGITRFSLETWDTVKGEMDG